MSASSQNGLPGAGASAQTAGFASTTWNPGDISPGLLLDPGNLRIEGDSGGGAGLVRATDGQSAGRFYFEVAMTGFPGPSGGVGIAAAAATAAGLGANGAGGAIALTGYSTGGRVLIDGQGAIDVFDTRRSGAFMRVAVDVDARLIWFATDEDGETWNRYSGPGDPAAGTGGLSFAALQGPVHPVLVTSAGHGESASVDAVANFGATLFRFAPPAGFSTGAGPAPAPAPLPLDGLGTGDAAAASQVSADIATTGAAVVVVLAYAEAPGGPPALSGISAPGLVFQRRCATPLQSAPSSGNGILELWWAAASQPLPGVTITATYAADFENAALAAFGVPANSGGIARGCDPAAPWDGHPSHPALYAGDGGAVFGNVSTRGPSLLIFAQATSDYWRDHEWAPLPGFTAVAQPFSYGGGGFASLDINAQVVARQDHAAFSWRRGVTRASAILDALVVGPALPNAVAAPPGFCIVMA